MYILASNGNYLTAESGGGLNGDPARDPQPAREDALVCDRDQNDLDEYGDAWQQWTLVRNGDGTVSLKMGDWYVTAERSGGSYVSTDRTVNEAWQRFTLVPANDGDAFLCADGMHYLRVKPGDWPVVDAAGTVDDQDAIVFHLPEAPPVVITPGLHADGVTLRNEAGERVSLCGYDQFLALRYELDGVDLQPFISESHQLGFNLWRVFGQASSTENGYYTLKPSEPGYYEALARLAAKLHDQGIYLLLTVYADNQVLKSGAEHWARSCDAVRPYGPSTFVSGGNEWQKNGFDPGSLANPGLPWWSRGSSLGDEKPPDPNGATFCEFHPRRDYPKSLDDTVASATYIQYTYGVNIPLVIDEPPRMGEDGSGQAYEVPGICWQFARHYSSQCAGAVFHARPGQKGVLLQPGSVTMACAEAWADAWLGVPKD